MPYLHTAPGFWYWLHYQFTYIEAWFVSKAAALRSHSQLATAIFQQCSSLAYTSTGANCLNAASLWKSYTEEDKMCAEFIQTIRLYPEKNFHLCDEIDEVCCSWLVYGLNSITINIILCSFS